MNDAYAHGLYRCDAHGKRYCAECIKEAVDTETTKRRLATLASAAKKLLEK